MVIGYCHIILIVADEEFNLVTKNLTGHLILIKAIET